MDKHSKLFTFHNANPAMVYFWLILKINSVKDNPKKPHLDNEIVDWIEKKGGKMCTAPTRPHIFEKVDWIEKPNSGPHIFSRPSIQSMACVSRGSDPQISMGKPGGGAVRDRGKIAFLPERQTRESTPPPSLPGAAEE